jgi:hypothetical protein
MGCKLSVSVVHPKKSPNKKKRKTLSRMDGYMSSDSDSPDKEEGESRTATPTSSVGPPISKTTSLLSLSSNETVEIALSSISPCPDDEDYGMDIYGR